MADLNNIYFDPKNPGSFGGPDRLQKIAKISKREAENFVQQQDTYTLNKSVRHKFQRRKITSHEIDYLWQADLVTVSKSARINKGFKYLLTVIDVLSRYAFVQPIRNKTGKDVTEAFAHIFSTTNRKPKLLQTDQGLEFFNRNFTTFLANKNVVLFHNHSPLKAAMVERFNRSLMMRLQKLFTYRKTKVYYDVLQDIVSSYNNSCHRIIGCAPNEVNKYNQMDVWLKSNKDIIHQISKKPKFKVHDIVRIKITKSTFCKGYASTYDSKLYRIDEVINSKPITYNLVSNSGDKIAGIFYSEELSRVKL